MSGSCPYFVRFGEKKFSGSKNGPLTNVILVMQRTGNEKPVDMPEDAHEDLTSHSPESRWIRMGHAYRRIPILGWIPAQGLAGLAAVLSILLAILFPQKELFGRDQYTDQKLEAMARQGNQAVKRYLAQKRQSDQLCGQKTGTLASAGKTAK